MPRRTGLLPAWIFWPVLCLFAAAGQADAQPQRLSQTGLFAAGQTQQTTAGVMTFSPQYPLWSDGTTKRRWLYLPPGRFIDARDADAWVFPAGTKLWKEFAYGARVETRYIERRADGSWLYASYVWKADGSDALLAASAGVSLSVPDAPGGRYDVPSRGDCLACHGGAGLGKPVPVLGVSALQLSSERDPLAAHASAQPGDVDLRALVARGQLRHLAARWLQEPPRIAAATPAERAARGYLHGNCGHCHHVQGVPVPLSLAQPLAGTSAPPAAQLSKLLQRMTSREPFTQMPPLGTRVPDAQGLALVQAWLDASQGPSSAHHANTTRTPKETTP